MKQQIALEGSKGPHSNEDQTYLLRRLHDNEIVEIPRRIAEDYIDHPQAGFEFLGLKANYFALHPEIAADLTRKHEERVTSDNKAQAEFEKKRRALKK